MDFRDFHEEGKEKPKKRPSDVDGQHHRWWLLAAGDGKTAGASPAADAIGETLNILDRAQSGFIAQIIKSTRMYGNAAQSGTSNGIVYGGASAAGAANAPGRDRLTYNLVQSAIDSATAMAAANQPKPYFLTNGGDYRQQRKAKRLNEFIDGVFNECEMREKGPMAFRDGAVWGDGWVKIFEKDGRVCMERVPGTELYIDEMEALFGQPRQMHHVRNVDRMVLADAFPSRRDVIMDATPSKIDNGKTPNVADVITVRESWHLPSGKNAKDGKHIITIDGAALTAMEPWDHPWFPFSRFRWCPRLYGSRSQGAAEQLQSIQIQINEINQTIQRSCHLGGSFKVLVENTSKIVKAHINNEVGTILTYTGTKPEYITPPMVQAELYQERQTLIQLGYALVGISEMSAASQKPAGLDSGKAIREFYDIGSSRQEWIGKEYERFHVDTGKKCVAIARDIAEENGGDYEVMTPGRRGVKRLSWSSIGLTEEEYVVQCVPVSALPDDPAGKLQTVVDYTQAGMLDQDTGRELLDFPDLKAQESMWDAPREWIRECLFRIVDDAEFIPPEPFDDLAFAVKTGLQVLAWGKTYNLEPERIELIRRFIQQAQSLLSTAMTPPPQMGGGSPQATPEQPPTSPLLPNAPQAAA